MGLVALSEWIEGRLAIVPNIGVILDYEPKSMQSSPLHYVLYEGHTETVAGDDTLARRYTIRIRTLIKWQENEGAENQLRPFVESISDAINSDPQPAGVISAGVVTVPRGQGGFYTIGTTLCRALDHYVEALVKTPYAGRL